MRNHARLVRHPEVETGIYGATLYGGKARLVRVEALLGRGLSRVQVVGMPDAVALEARERLPPALRRHGFSFPKGKVLFNLVPAQLPKSGLPLDLALAVAVLAAQRLLPPPRQPLLFLAELDLEGRLGPPARGTLLAAMAARGHLAGVVTAPEAAPEGALAPGVPVYGVGDLGGVAALLRDPAAAATAQPVTSQAAAAPPAERLDDVRGQDVARRAAIIAAAGRHALLLQGPPGTGKSLLARRLVNLLPPLPPERALELALIEAARGRVRALAERPPLRAPHTSISPQGMLGGGHPLRPGELSRAHGGVLFLDELPEFARPVLEGLRQPLEEKEVRLQRVLEQAVFPADVLLVAAMNLCPCGYTGHPKMPCACTLAQKQRYRARTSGPLLDRFDLFVEVGPVEPWRLQGPPTPPSDEEARAWLERAAALQRRRGARGRPPLASQASLQDLRAEGMAPQADALLQSAAERFGFSGRGCVRCLRVARTIADLLGCERVGGEHVREAITYRARVPGLAPSQAAPAAITTD